MNRSTNGAASGRGGGRPAAGGLPERPVHQSLVRTPRYAGVDRSFLVLEVTLVVCVAYLLGLSWATLGVVSVTVGVVHPLMVRLSAEDELLPHLVVRTLTRADAYDPLGAAGAPARKPRPSVPTP